MRLFRAGCVATFLGAGCSSFTAQEPSTAVLPDAGESVDAAPAPVDAGVPDAAPIRIDTTAWTSPNGATSKRTDAGTTFIDTKGPTTHPVIIPSGLPDFGSDDYTLYATVHAGTAGDVATREWGFVLRLPQDLSQGHAFGSTYDVTGDPFLSAFAGQPTWDVVDSTVRQGPSAPVVADRRYFVKVEAHGSTLKGKRWLVGDAEPDWQITYDGARTTGRTVGFYTYYQNNSELESLSYSVP